MQLVHKAQPEALATQVLQELRVRQELRERRVDLGSTDRQGRQVQPEPQDLQVPPEVRVPQEARERRDKKDRQVQPEQMAQQEIPDPRVPPEGQDQRDLLVLPDPRENRVPPAKTYLIKQII